MYNPLMAMTSAERQRQYRQRRKLRVEAQAELDSLFDAITREAKRQQWRLQQQRLARERFGLVSQNGVS